ncbi:MAG: NUDIX hydrolase [bacterium]
MRLVEKKIRAQVLYSGAVNFRVDTVLLPNGTKAAREFIDHPGAVGILPVLDNGDVVLVRQYRYPVKEATLEIPAGKLHNKKDDPLRRVREELREETGYTAGKITPLLSFWPTPAFSDELLRIYLAGELRPGNRNPDEDEFLQVVRMPFEKAWRMVLNGKIKDSKTVIALQARTIISNRR